MGPKKNTTSEKGKGKGVRGETECHYVLACRENGTSIHLDMDEEGIPSGPNYPYFVSWIGRTTKRFLHPLSTFNELDETLKKTFLDELTGRPFVIPEGRKWSTKWLKSGVNRALRDYRYEIGTYCTGGKNVGGDVFRKFSRLTEEQFEAVKKYREEERNKKKIETNKEIRKKNEFPVSTSRGGYALQKRQWKEAEFKRLTEVALEEGTNPPASIEDVPSPPRIQSWIRGHTRKDGTFYTEKCREVGERIEHYSQQESQGLLKPKFREDILVMAIGKPEHQGRVRAMGKGVGIKKYFGPKPSPHGQGKCLSLESMRDKWVELEQAHGDVDFKEFFKSMLFGSSTIPTRPDHTTHSHQPSRPTMDDISHHEEPIRNLDNDDDDFSSGEELGTNTDVPPRYDDPVSALASKCIAFFGQNDGPGNIRIPVPQYVTSNQEETADLDVSEIQSMIADDWLCAAWLQVALMEMHRLCRERNRTDISFATPVAFNSLISNEERMNYLGRFFENCKYTNFMPVNKGQNHWVLLVIFPASHRICVLDPLNLPLKSCLEHGVVDNIVDAYKSRFGCSPKWNTFTVPQQPGSWQCGYFVIHFMREMILRSNGSFTPKDYRNIFGTKTPLTENELNGVKKLLATFVLDYMWQARL